MSATRAASLAAVVLVAVLVLAVCTPSSQKTAVAGRTPAPTFVTFHGFADPAAGTIEIHPDPVVAPGGLTIIEPVQDGHPGSGPDDTIEVRTLAASSGYEADGCTTGLSGFTGTIRLQSFFRNQALNDVYVELVEVTPSGYGASVCDGVETTAPAGPGPGPGTAHGLWSYGDLAPVSDLGGDHFADVTWRFRDGGGQAFHFTGRVWATIGAPGAGVPEFDWTPGIQNQAPRAFQEPGSTIAHVVWDGARFVDLVNPELVFTAVGAPTSTYSLYPNAAYAGGFTADPYTATSTYFWADPGTVAGLPALLSGDFTVCAKVKPGEHPFVQSQTWPGSSATKILFAFGQAEPYTHPVEGWNLMQMHYGYCFHYHTAADYAAAVARGKAADPTAGPIGDDTMVFMRQYLSTSVHDWENADIKTYAYDYFCGGRSGDGLLGNSHGAGLAGQFSSYGGDWSRDTFAASGEGLRLSIGAYPGQTVTDDTWGGTCELIGTTASSGVPCTLANQDPVCAGYNNGGLTTGYCNYGFCDDPPTTPCRNGNAATACGGGACVAHVEHPVVTVPAGVNPAVGAGVYEVIITSDAASIANFNSIVGAAEGRKLPGNNPATYFGSGPDPVSITGSDGQPYVFAPYLTVPVARDNTGRLEEGGVVRYLGPLTNTSTSGGYCVGVTVKPAGAWESVGGGILGYDDSADFVTTTWGAGSMVLTATTFRQLGDAPVTWSASGSAERVIKACVNPGGSTTTVYVDGVSAGSGPNGGAALNLAAATSTRLLHIGEGGGAALTGARIRRVFICPSSDPETCL